MEPQARATTDEAVDVHLRDYLWVLRKHLGAALTFFVVVVVAVAVVTFRARPMYRAQAELYIERQSHELASLREVYDLGASSDEYRKTQHQLVRSRQIAEAVFRRNGLADHPLFADAPDPVEAFRDLVTVTPKEGTYLATVAVEGLDGREAADWANDLVDEYLSYVEQKHRTTSSEVQRSLNEEIPRLRRKLLESEAKLIEFQRRDNVLSFEKQQEIMFRKVQELEDALTLVQKQRISLEAQLRVMEALAQHGGENGRGAVPVLPEGVETPLLASYRSREIALVEELGRCRSRYKTGHPKLTEVRDRLEGLRERIRAEVDRVRRTLSDSLAVKNAEAESLGALVRTQSEAIQKLEEKSNRYQALRSEVESNRRMYNEFLERRKELESTSGFGAMNVSVVDRALPPSAPVRPKKWLNLTLAVIVGLLGGVALAFFFEYLDDTVKTPEEVKDVLGLPFLGLIPVIGRADMEEGGGVVTRGERFSGVAEAFRTVRTGLSFALSDREGGGVFVVTSPGPREGKTLNAVNLSITLAQQGRSVLLVDADLRKPTVHRMLALPNEEGLSTLLAGGEEPGRAVQASAVENLSVIPSGPIPPNPSELLGSARMASLLEGLSSSYDFVVFDSPPTGAVTDAVVLASRVDGVILILSAGTTRRKSAQHCVDQIRRVRGNLLGVVLNAFQFSSASYYRYAYYHRPYYTRHGAEEEDRAEA